MFFFFFLSPIGWETIAHVSCWIQTYRLLKHQNFKYVNRKNIIARRNQDSIHLFSINLFRFLVNAYLQLECRQRVGEHDVIIRRVTTRWQCHVSCVKPDNAEWVTWVTSVSSYNNTYFIIIIRHYLIFVCWRVASSAFN